MTTLPFLLPQRQKPFMASCSNNTTVSSREEEKCGLVTPLERKHLGVTWHKSIDFPAEEAKAVRGFATRRRRQQIRKQRKLQRKMPQPTQAELKRGVEIIMMPTKHDHLVDVYEQGWGDIPNAKYPPEDPKWTSESKVEMQYDYQNYFDLLFRACGVQGDTFSERLESFREIYPDKSFDDLVRIPKFEFALKRLVRTRLFRFGNAFVNDPIPSDSEVETSSSDGSRDSISTLTDDGTGGTGNDENDHPDAIGNKKNAEGNESSEIKEPPAKKTKLD
jgi:hypothetical protein